MNEQFYISLIGEAFDGYTEAVFEGQTVYVKHVSIRDQRYLHKYHDKYKQLALAKGLQSEEDKLKYVIDEGIWEEKDDLQIEALTSETENLKRTARAIFLQSQRDSINQQIEENKKKIFTLQQKRKEVVGQTADDYADSRSGDEILRFLLFKDEELTENFFSNEEFSELEGWEILKLSEIQLKVSKKISDLRIQEAVLRPFFHMYLPFCNDANAFYHKPVTHLTIYHMRVLLYGKIFHSIFQNVEDIPDHIKQDPEKLLLFSESKTNKGSSKELVRDGADGTAVFGATDEDVKDLQGKAGGVLLSDELEKHGGKLDMKQMMRLAGHDV